MTVCSKFFWTSRLKYRWFLVFSDQRIAVTKSQWTHCSNNWPIYPILSNIRISLQNSKQSLLELSRELILHALCNPWNSSSKRLINLLEFSLFSKGHFYIFLKNWEGGQCHPALYSNNVRKKSQNMWNLHEQWLIIQML